MTHRWSPHSRIPLGYSMWNRWNSRSSLRSGTWWQMILFLHVTNAFLRHCFWYWSLLIKIQKQLKLWPSISWKKYASSLVPSSLTSKRSVLMTWHLVQSGYWMKIGKFIWIISVTLFWKQFWRVPLHQTSLLSSLGPFKISAGRTAEPYITFCGSAVNTLKTVPHPNYDVLKRSNILLLVFIP